ncbi:MAG: carboxypeptidase regulatory-like domain-containing protein [Acidobacteria bacterium]|nr:carboxypeptidase regulatory-like domain-containing protein [Acidobacteriota bacterium]
MRRFLIVLISFLLAESAFFAQNNSGAITGTITDSAGALMPGVRIDARNTETGLQYQVASSATGSYTIAQLPTGKYRISVSIPGFKPYTRTDIEVLDTQIIRIDIYMEMLGADEILTNDSVIQLLTAGITEDLIISKIRESQHNFDLSVQGMVALKDAGASDRLMQVMLDPGRVLEETPPPSPKETPAAEKEPEFPTDAGVYVKSGKEWVPFEPEFVIWETGGTFRRLVTAGIAEGDLNGRIEGAHSGNVVKTPLEFIIVAPEEVDIKEYLLIRLRIERNDRKFQIVSGGLFSSTEGAEKDAVEFEGTKAADRTFSVKLKKLEAGEYGFLPNSPAAGAPAGGKVGKMYTFQVSNIIN